MKKGLSDFVEQMRVRGASVLSPNAEPSARATAADQPASDEAALMNMLRLLSRMKSAALTPVQRAFVLGAKTLFQELTAICDQLLTPPAPSPAAVPPPANAVEPEAAPTAPRARASRRPTPGGASPPQ